MCMFHDIVIIYCKRTQLLDIQDLHYLTCVMDDVCFSDMIPLDLPDQYWTGQSTGDFGASPFLY